MYKPSVSSCFLTINPPLTREPVVSSGGSWAGSRPPTKAYPTPFLSTLTPVPIFSPTPLPWFIVRLRNLRASSEKWWSTKNTALWQHVWLLFLLFFNTSFRWTKQWNKGREKVLWMRRWNIVIYFVHFNYTQSSFNRSPRILKKSFHRSPFFWYFPFKASSSDPEHKYLFFVILKTPTSLYSPWNRLLLCVGKDGHNWTVLLMRPTSITPLTVSWHLRWAS